MDEVIGRDQDLVSTRDRRALEDLLVSIQEATDAIPPVAELLRELADELASQSTDSSAAVLQVTRLDAGVRTLLDTAMELAEAVEMVDATRDAMVPTDDPDEEHRP
jgi:hypothetical protein